MLVKAEQLIGLFSFIVETLMHISAASPEAYGISTLHNPPVGCSNNVAEL